MRFVLLAGAALILCGCPFASLDRLGESQIILHEDQEAMRAEVLRHIPIGTPVNEAEKVLQANGFQEGFGGTHDSEILKGRLRYYKNAPSRSFASVSDSVVIYLDFEGNRITKI